MRSRCILIACLPLAALLSACERSHEKPKSAAPPKVTVARPIERDVRPYEDFLGRTNAVHSVELRARVTGYLNKVCFRDGDTVEAGTLLYEIDPRPFQDELDRVKGDLERLHATQKLLDLQVVRYTQLVKDKAAPQQSLDEYLSKQSETVGAIHASEAQKRQAELNLAFTKVTAPISGKIGRTLLTEGNLVKADTTQLCTIVSIHPIYAYFSIEEPTLVKIRRDIYEGKIKTLDNKSIEVFMGLSDDTERKFPLRGVVDFVDNTVDPDTGTIALRGVFDNSCLPGRAPLMEPGMSTRMRLHSSESVHVFLIDARAVGTDQGNKYVYVIDEHHRASARNVRLGQIFDGLLSVESGLKPGDRVVISGLQRIRPGLVVEPEEVDMLQAVASQKAEPHAPPKVVAPKELKESKPEPAAKPAPATKKSP